MNINLTQSALCINKEWNVKTITSKDGSYYKNVINEFNNVYFNSCLVEDDDLNNYEDLYDSIKRGYSNVSV